MAYRITKRATAFLLAVLFAVTLACPSFALEDPVIDKARYAYLYNIENERVLFTQNADEAIYPASMVKIMTAILAIEHMGDRWDEMISIPEAAVEASRGMATRISLKAGEEITVGDLITSIIVGGANDAALAAAILVSGSVEKFVSEMNIRAKELGANDTHFTNPTGIHDDRMTTTLADMAAISLHAYHLTRFIDASSLERYVIGPTNTSKNYRYIVNRNYFVSNTVVYDYYNPAVVGLNAGSTSQAGNVVVAIAAIEGATQLCIIAGAQSEPVYGPDPETGEEVVVKTINHAYTMAQRLLDWSFDGYDYVDILSSARIICEIPVKLSAKVDHVTLLPANGITEYMPNDIDVERDIVIDWTTTEPYLDAPVERGQVAGTLKLYYDGELLEEVDLVAQNTVDRDEWLYILRAVTDFIQTPGFIAFIITLIVLLTAYVFIISYLRGRAQQKRRRDRNITPRG